MDVERIGGESMRLSVDKQAIEYTNAAFTVRNELYVKNKESLAGDHCDAAKAYHQMRKTVRSH